MSQAVHHHAPCCHGHQVLQESSLSESLFHLLEKVSAIAIGVFAAYASFELFLSFFALGTAVGLYQYFSAEPDQGGPSAHSSCTQGFMEQLTHVKLPPLLSLAANLAITWCHIDHHTTVFVPVVGVSIGAWAGQTMGELGSKICPVKRGVPA